MVYVDTQAMVYGVEHHAKYAGLLAPLWAAQQSGALQVVTSHMTLMECLIMPLRKQDAPLIANFEQTFKSPGLRIIPIDEPVLRAAAQLRATHQSLRTPDAIHAASCFSTSASLFVTNDRGFRAIPGLPLALLDDILASP